MTRTLTYGDSGNTASDDDGAGTVLTHIYDSTDRLVEIKQGAATVAAYLHNAKGQRVAKTIGATTTHYVYGPGGLIAEADGATGAARRNMSGSAACRWPTSRAGRSTTSTPTTSTPPSASPPPTAPWSGTPTTAPSARPRSAAR